MKNKIIIFFFLFFSLISVGRLQAENNDKVKDLLQEGLKLYGDHQYVRALDLFKQAQALDPVNATADEYIKNTKQRILEWELQGSDQSEKKNVNWDNLTQGAAGLETSPNAKDIIAARRSLVERMKTRSSNTDDIVQIQETGKGLEITLFQDQLFVPGLTTLRDEALPILQHVSDMIRTGGDRTVTVKSAIHVEGEEDPYLLYPEFSLPARDPNETYAKKPDSTTSNFQNLELTRSLILFSYLGQRAMGQSASSIIE